MSQNAVAKEEMKHLQIFYAVNRLNEAIDHLSCITKRIVGEEPLEKSDKPVGVSPTPNFNKR